MRITPAQDGVPGAPNPAYTQVNAPASDDVPFTTGDLIRVVKERRGPILKVAACVVLLTVAVLLFLPSVYTSTAKVLLDPRRNRVTDLTAVVSNTPTDPASVQNQTQILTSRDLAAEVITKLDLANDAEFAGSGNGTSDMVLRALGMRHSDQAVDAPSRDTVIEAFLEHLSVAVEGVSTTIDITFKADSAEKAARIANAVADAYIHDQIGLKTEAAQATTSWLNTRIDQLEKQVQAAEAAVQTYKAENGITDITGITGGTSIADQQLTAINTQLVQARANLAQQEAISARVKALTASGNGADVAQVVASQVIVELRAQEAELIRQEADLATRYGPEHPRMIAVESEKKNLEAKINGEVQRIAGSAANEVAVARAQVQSLEQALAQAEQRANRDNEARVKLQALQADATSTRTMYETFVSRLRETQDQDNAELADVRVISSAPVPKAPSSPKRRLILAASIPAGLLLGLLVAMMYEIPSIRRANGKPVRGEYPYTDKQVRPRAAAPTPVSVQVSPQYVSPERRAAAAPVPRTRPVPVVAEFALSQLAYPAADRVIGDPASPFALEAAQLERRCASIRSPNGAPIIALTSAEPGEGKTTLAIALARSAALRGQKAVIVDGNLREPSVAWTMAAPAPPSGLINALQGTAPLSQAFARDPLSSVLVLASSARPLHPAQIFASQPMKALMTHLQKSCDLVILDTTPVLTAEETLPAIALADAVLLVARAENGPRDTVTQAIGRLQTQRAPLAGIVLTR
jgi:capsular exopolysaccharide synthesis family protein